MNTKAKGRRGDKKAIALSLAHGATDSMVSTASLGVFDIICWGKSGAMFIQNKTNTKASGTEMLGLMRATVPAGSIKAMLVWVDRQRFPDFYLVSRTEIDLLSQGAAEKLMRETFNNDATD